MKQTFTAAVGAAMLAAGAAQAHVVLSPDSAPPGGYYAGELRVSHGCSGSPTRRLRVEIPAQVVSAKPQPKPGWTLRIEREPLAAPLKGEGGHTIRDRVSALTWSGRLPDDQFDTFGLMLRLPAGEGPLYLPVVQTCEAGETRWTDKPAAGQAWHDVAHPAPVLTLAPSAADAHAEHRH